MLWNLISIQILIISFLTTFLIAIPKKVGRIYLAFSLLSSILFIFNQSFIYLVISQLVGTIIYIKYSRGYLRIGWSGILLSNLLWMLMRYGILLGILGLIDEELNIYRFDNDIYHFMLIGSTFFLFKSVNKELWPKKGTI